MVLLIARRRKRFTMDGRTLQDGPMHEQTIIYWRVTIQNQILRLSYVYPPPSDINIFNVCPKKCFFAKKLTQVHLEVILAFSNLQPIS